MEGLPLISPKKRKHQHLLQNGPGRKTTSIPDARSAGKFLTYLIVDTIAGSAEGFSATVAPNTLSLANAPVTRVPRKPGKLYQTHNERLVVSVPRVLFFDIFTFQNIQAGLGNKNIKIKNDMTYPIIFTRACSAKFNNILLISSVYIFMSHTKYF